LLQKNLKHKIFPLRSLLSLLSYVKRLHRSSQLIFYHEGTKGTKVFVAFFAIVVSLCEIKIASFLAINILPRRHKGHKDFSLRSLFSLLLCVKRLIRYSQLTFYHEGTKGTKVFVAFFAIVVSLRKIKITSFLKMTFYHEGTKGTKIFRCVLCFLCFFA
jgi:hypothetical protein